MNDKQKSRARDLIREYGVPDIILKSEINGETIIRMDYCGSHRHFFINEQGERIFWTEAEL